MTRQLSILNAEPRLLPGPRLLHHLVSDVSTSAATAIEHCREDGLVERISYDDLDLRSTMLAGKLLHARGTSAPAGHRRFIVPLWIPQSLDLYICQLAILKAGGAFCPIALDAPEERLRFILQDVEAKILVTVSASRHMLPQIEGILVVNADERPPIALVESLPVSIEPSQAAYIMYTSGSTGTPKGVVISHLAATQALLAHERHIPRFSRFLQFANPTFDVSVFEIFFPLYRGATLVSCERRRLLNDLSGVIHELRVDAAELTPSVANSLLHDRRIVPSLQLLLTIGEMLKRSVVEEFASDSENPGILCGMYGPTEASIHCTLQPNFTTNMAVNNIGFPLDTVSAFVVELASDTTPDATPNIVDLGEKGELVLGGHQLADGYLNRSEQTRAAFVQHPKFGRLYRTGDRARMTPERTIECLGRIASGQVKLRGQRIELGEVEYAVARTHGCRSVVADVIDGNLVAFICVNPNVSVTPDEARQSCKKWLPAFMVPAEFVIINALPYLASGKVDRTALSEHYSLLKRAPPTAAQVASPRALEIASIIGKVLHVAVDAYTHLPGAGLDSLSAIRIASQLNRCGFPAIDANTILQAHTVREVDSAIAQAEQTARLRRGPASAKFDTILLEDAVQHHPLLDNLQENIERVFVTTSMQSAMLTETARDQQSQAYCNWVKLDLANGVQLSRVEAALRQLTKRHELLRSGFLTLEKSGVSHAGVVWKWQPESHITIVEAFDHHFSIRNEEDALHPSRIEIRQVGGRAQVLLKMHHALYDKWSIDVLKADLYLLLQDRCLDHALPFSEVSAFYAANLEDACCTQAIDFWQDHLRDFTITAVPDLVGHAEPSSQGVTPWQSLSVDVDEARNNARQLGYSLPAVYQAAFAYLTAAYSGSQDVMFGTVFSGRHIAVPGIERTFGPCLVTLPSRLDLSSVRTCLDLLRLTHDRNRAMQHYAFTPLVDIRKAGQCMPGTVLFDTLFVWQETSLSFEEHSTLVTEADSADHHEFNLVLEFAPSATGVEVRATYEQSLLSTEQASIVLRQVDCIAKHLLRQPKTSIGELVSCFSENLLSISNRRPSPYAHSLDIVSAVEEAARLRPSSLALSFARNIDFGEADITNLSYADLNARSNNLAHYLHSLGVGPGDLVCICMEKSFDLYVAILGILKSGAGYLPLIPDTPSARVGAILNQASVRLCLCDTPSVSMISSVSSTMIVDAQQLKLDRFSGKNPHFRSSGSDLAYVVFTSGSTGEPKGVSVTRNNLAGNLNVLSELYRTAPGDRLLQACSQAFDVSVFEIFFAFSTGMCLCAATKDVLFHDLERSIRALEVTHLSLTPTVAALVDPVSVPNVRFLVTAGEAITDVVHKQWAGKGLLSQGYGPSETTNICTVNLNMTLEQSLGNVGRPLANTSAFVLSPDNDFNVLPTGAVGEFAFGGEQVFRGYLGRDDLNATKLIDHPTYGRIYRSGDIGRILSDGTLLIIGRLDEQVKLRGNRIELGEIDAALRQSPDVSDCTTLVFDDGHTGQALATFWVPQAFRRQPSHYDTAASVHRCPPFRSGLSFAGTETMQCMHKRQVIVAEHDPQAITRLFHRLDASLPSYMVPTLLIPIHRMPMTTQGKLDRKMLFETLSGLDEHSREAFSRKTGDDADTGDDWSASEEKLATALLQTLHVARSHIRRTTSFFALGLSSLSAIALAKRVEKMSGHRVGVNTIMRNSSVAQLGAALSQSNAARPERKVSAASIFPSSFVAAIKADCEAQGLRVEAVLPCTSLQEAMLSATATQGQLAYLNSVSFALSGNVEKIRQCWSALAARHAILRTHFVDTDNAAFPYAQVVIKHKALPWRVLGDYEHGHTPVEPAVSMSEPFNIKLDPKTTPPFMTVQMHHAIYDGISMSLLLEEAEQLYHGTSLPAPVSFEPFLSEALAQSGAHAMEFWSARMQGYLPQPFPQTSVTDSIAQRTVTQTSVIRTAELEAFSKRHSITSLSVFQTAWAKVLSSSQQVDDICFGSVVSGRSASVPGIDTLVAPCFNSVPLRINLAQCRTSVQLSRLLHAQNVESVGYQLASLRHIQRLSKSPDLHLFDSILLLQPPSRTLDSSIWQVIEEQGSMDMPIVLEIVPEGEAFVVSLHFLTQYVSSDLANSLIHAFVSALSTCVRYSSGEVHSLGEDDRIRITGSLASRHRHTETDENGLHPRDQGTAWTVEEAHVRGVFADLSGTDADRIAKSTSMYQLGLDSLNAPQVAARLRKLGVQVDATDVMEGLTPSAIAGPVTRQYKSAAERAPPTATDDLHTFDGKYRQTIATSIGLEIRDVEAVRPCTAVQCGMLTQSLQCGGGLYVNHITYEVPEGIDYVRLRKAWKAVQQKHQALRMGFCRIDDLQKPFAMILWKGEAVQEPLTVFDSDREQPVERHVVENIVGRLHLPAWRVSVVQSRGRMTMMLTLSHAIYDAESLQLLLSDFEDAIHSRDLGYGADIDTLLASTLSAEIAHPDAASFWRTSLKDTSPSKFPNLSPTKPGRSEMLSVKQECSLHASTLEQYCKVQSATIQAVGQTTWALLLSAYTGEADALFGTVFSGRSGSRSEATAFPSISMIPVRCSTNRPKADVVAHMVTYNAAAHRHRFTPLADIRRFAGAAQQGLFDTVFVYQKASSSKTRFSWPMIRETAAVDYVASMELEIPSSGKIMLRLTVDSSRIPEAHAQLLIRQYEYTLAQLIGCSGLPEERHGSIHSVSPAKEESIPSAATLLHHFVESSAQQHPDRPALEFVTELRPSVRTQTWTFVQLNERGNQVAHLLREHGVKEGSIVAVRMQKCPEASLAFVGILKAGCSFLALDPDLPAARQTFILQDSGASIVFTHYEETDTKKIGEVQVVGLSESLLNQYPLEAVPLQASGPEATCYCLYTSGTTGSPKGCEITHENAIQAMLAFQRLFAGHWDESSRWLQFASYWFDVSVLEQFWSWSVGVTVVSAKRDTVLGDLAGFIDRAQITHIDLTPSLARLLRPDDVPSLQKGVFITGGEALKQEIIDAWGSTHVICNGYGPTEATIGVTMNTFVGSDAIPSNIGKQFDNVGAYVLAPGTEDPVLRGAVGELCVSGKLVGKGYLNKPELTAKAFPYLKKSRERVYRTGDLVRLLADGSFSFLGRIDTQAKLRGQRLELGEIDSVISAASEQAIEVASMVYKDEKGGKETLMSFLTTAAARSGEDCKLDANQATQQLLLAADQACRSKLPAYMLPSHLIPVTFIPLTVNNKVDAKRLLTLFESLSIDDLQKLKNSGSEGTLSTVSERRVSRVLSKILNLDTKVVQRDSNIFSLGLSSISAITLASLLKREGFGAANVTVVMKNPIVSQLSSALCSQSQSHREERDLVRQSQLSITAFEQRHRNVAARRLHVSPDDIEAVTPCTPLQEGLLFESMRHSERPYFNEFHYVLEYTDLEQLERALRQITADIQILRARFVQTDDGYAQVVLKKADVPWQCHTAPDRDPEGLLSDERALWLERNRQDLLQPIRAVMLHFEGSDTLTFFVHHALYDGIGWQLLLDHLAASYLKRKPAVCGPGFTQALPYGPLCTQQGAKPFWERRLVQSQFEPLPTIAQDTGRATHMATSRISTVDDIETVRMKLGVSHQAFAQVCFEAALLHAFPHTRTYGHVVSGRSIDLDDADRVIGPLFNTLPQVVSIGPDDTWPIAMKRTHDANAAALPFQHTPLREIRRWGSLKPTNQMFDVLFVFQHAPEHDLAEECGLWKPVESEPHAEYPLAFEVTLGGEGTLEVVAIAKASVADDASLNRLLQSFAEAVEIASKGIDTLIADNFTIPNTREWKRAYRPTTPEAQPNGVQDFAWTDEAVTLRRAIAQIAGLEVQAVDEHSTIFSIGLDSIDAVKLASRLKRAGLSLPVSKILQAQTIPRMLDAVQIKQPSAGAGVPNARLGLLENRVIQSLKATLSDVEAVDRILPATPNQEALIADMLRTDWQDYYNHDILHLCADVDTSRLRAAWQTVVDKSPILRTAFVQVDDPQSDLTFAQVVYRPRPLKFKDHELDTRSEIDDVLKLITNEARSKSSATPPLRLTLVTVHTERHLILSLAHAQYDGHALALLHEDVRRAYQDTMEERPSNDSVIESSLNANNEEARDFWSSALSGASPVPFPRLDEAEAALISHRAERPSTISLAVARSFCQKHGVSIQALVQTCWALALASYTRSLEVIYGVVLACRDSEEAERVMFPTMNTVPVRATLYGSRADMLKYMQGMSSDMRTYQRTPLRTIQAVCSDIKHTTSSPSSLFDTLLIYQHRPDSSHAESQPLYKSVGGSSSVEYPVALEMEAVGDHLFLRAACKGSVLDEDGTKRLLDNVDHVLSSIVDSPEDSTVSFAESELSICGLPWFQLDPEGSETHEASITRGNGDHDPDATELSPIAMCIREALAQVAKVPSEDIVATASIESIGIDSISAIKVAALLRKQDVKISVSEIIRARTVVKMAEIVVAKSEAAGAASLPSKDVVQEALRERGLTDLSASLGVGHIGNVESILPATAGQLYMLSIWQSSHGQMFYPTFSYELQASTVDMERMRGAWKQLVARHAILRTVFCATGDECIPTLQVVLREPPDSFSEGEYSATDDGSIGQPMVSLHVTKTENAYSLRLSIHHALYDAVSLPLLMQDFQDLLDAAHPKLPAIKHEDFIALSVNQPSLQTRKAFWISYLRDAKPLRLTAPRSGGAQKRVEIYKPGTFTGVSALEGLARTEGVTIQALLFAIYSRVYAELAIQGKTETTDEAEDVVLGIYLANRSHLPELDLLAAPTLNLVPLLVRSPRRKSLLDIAKQIQRDLQEVGTAQNSAVGLWEIAEWTGVRVDTFVNFLKLPEQSEDDGVSAQQSVVKLREGSERRMMAYSHVTEPEVATRTFAPPKELQKMRVVDAYQSSLDLEATVANGSLDIGLFCSAEMLGLRKAEAVIDEMKSLLEKLLKKAQV